MVQKFLTIHLYTFHYLEMETVPPFISKSLELLLLWKEVKKETGKAKDMLVNAQVTAVIQSFLSFSFKKNI